MFKNIAIIIITVLVLGIGFFGWYYSNQINNRPVQENVHSTQVEFVIEEGWGVQDIASSLVDQNLINSKASFYWYLFSNNLWSSLQPGKYTIKTDSTIPELVAVLSDGTDQKTTLTIPEGWGVDEIDEYLAENDLIEVGEFKKEAKKSKFITQNKFLKINQTNNLEGFLFPDTYFVYSQEDGSGNQFEVSAFTQKMLTNFNQKIYQEYRKKKLPTSLDSFYQALVLASVVEKEADTFEDRQIVAGIFLKRLQNDVFLQACSTVNYLLPEKKDILKASDLLIDSKYNTYKYKALPPGPICNPGEESIQAVLKPKTTKYWYFLSDSNGQLHYATTNEQHDSNKERYL